MAIIGDLMKWARPPAPWLTWKRLRCCIRRCIGWLNCFTFNYRKEIQPPRVSRPVNPEVPREESMGEFRPAGKKQENRHCGGLAGMTAASTLASRGNKAILHEKTGELGGQWLAASVGPQKSSYRAYAAWLINQLNETGVEIRLSSAPSPEEIKGSDPDAIILATGAVPRQLGDVDIVPDIHSCGVNILYGIDVLRGKPVPGKKVAVLGGRYIGVETALMLDQKAYEASLADMTEIGQGRIPRIRGILFQRLAQSDIRVFPNSSLFRISPHTVELAHGGSVFPLACDSLVLAIGTAPDRTRQEVDFGLSVYVIGDCRKIGDARKAVAEGAEAGLRI